MEHEDISSRTWNQEEGLGIKFANSLALQKNGVFGIRTQLAQFVILKARKDYSYV